MADHRACRHYTPAMSANRKVENREHHGTCGLPFIQLGDQCVSHLIWRAVMGDEPACGDFEAAK